jgi:hypothetical protein
MLNESISTWTIGGINRLKSEDKRRIYTLLIPENLRRRFGLAENFLDPVGNDLITLDCPDGSMSTEMELFHRVNFKDPVLFGHIADTLTGHVHVLLYVLNDPFSPRFDTDRMPDGSPTCFGTLCRNLPAELEALNYGLAPGQIRRGLRLLGAAIKAFEKFVEALGQDLYFVDPLYYHNAIIFERYGFAYERGKRVMDRVQAGLSEHGDLIAMLDGTPFRSRNAMSSIRLRSWAIHDGILGEPYTDVTMYKRIGRNAGINSSPNCVW